jgi:YYY domain-containing protein
MQVLLSDMAWQTQATTPTPEPLTYDQPVGTLPIVDDARWSASLTDNSFAALLVWILLLVVLQAATWPLVQRLFRRFPDGGWAYARLTTLSLAAFLVWYPTAISVTEFRAIWCWIGLLLVAAASWYWGRRFPLERTEEQNTRRIAILGAEVAFWLAFFVFLLFRFINPDSYEPVWGGEKPMEFAHINSILRSAHFPPVDPWFSGGYLNYYYYGSYLVAFLVKLTGIPSEIAFNLALPFFLAMLASGMFSLGFAISRSLSRSTTGALVTGATATIFSVFIGNLVDAARSLEQITGDKPRYLWDYWVWGPTRIFPKFIITEFPYFAGLYGDLHAHTIALPITVLIAALTYSLFQQRDRFAGIDPKQGVSVLAAPGLVLGILLGTVFMTNAWDAPTYAVLVSIGVVSALVRLDGTFQRVALAAAVVAAIGIVAYIAIIPFNRYYVALFSEIDTVPDKTPLLPVEAHWGGFILIMTAGFAAFGFPRERRGQWLLDPLVVLPTLGFVLCTRWYGVSHGESIRDLADYLTVIVVGTTWLAIAWFGIEDEADFGLPEILVRGVLAGGSIVAVGGLVTERPVFALYVAIGAAAGVAWLANRNRVERYLFALIAIGMLLGAALELVFLVDDLLSTDAYRMNTVFKFYNQLWTLFAIASAGCVARMLSILLPPHEETLLQTTGEDASVAPSPSSADRIRTGWSRAGLVITSLVVLAGFAYPAQATGVRLDTRFPHPDSNLTLDAYAWMNYASITYTNGEAVTYADDLAAIEWFNEEVPGNPVIAEASFGTYRCNGSRFSIATGLPVVLGWERHEQQQRDRTLLPERARDLREIYESTDVVTKMDLIEKYGVEYVIVGQTERLYPRIVENRCEPQDVAAGIAAIEGMVGTHLEVAFSHGTTTVYRVLR